MNAVSLFAWRICRILQLAQIDWYPATPYRTTPRITERKEARRQLFIETAVRLFGVHGYTATTVPMIVQAARVDRQFLPLLQE